MAQNTVQLGGTAAHITVAKTAVCVSCGSSDFALTQDIRTAWPDDDDVYDF